jgi:starvation-inducible DNA-binding protein
MPQTTLFGRKNIQVTFQPNIGLDASARQSVVEILNLLLADEAVLSLKMHHGNTPSDGVNDLRLQPLYDAQYNQIQTILDELVERIQILGGAPSGDVEESIKDSRLDGKLAVNPGIMSILADQEAFIRFLREDAQKCSDAYEDQGTYALLIDILRSHEKMAWVLRSNIALGQLD